MRLNLSRKLNPSFGQARDLSTGRGLAALLTGAWRVDPTALTISELEIETIAPHIRAAGAQALVYRRLGSSALNLSESVLGWRTLYHENAARSLRWLYFLRQVFNELRAVGIESILFKGWAIARHYSEVVLRPLGDVDLFVPPADETRARQVLQGLGLEHVAIDLHTQTDTPNHASRLVLSSLTALYSRSQLVDLDGVGVRVLSPEDHLHLLCLHFMRHGGWRALWLCDVAAALESRPANFDWELALERIPIRFEELVGAIPCGRPIRN